MSPEAAKPEKFVRRVFQDTLAKSETLSQQANAAVEAMQKFTKSTAPESARQKAEQLLPVAELEARNMATRLQNMKKVDEFLKTLGGGVKIQFRVYYDADSTEVVLLQAGN
jgi:S-adenosylmethionine synthetase